MKEIGYDAIQAVDIGHCRKGGLWKFVFLAVVKGYVLGSSVFMGYYLLAPAKTSERVEQLARDYSECRDIMSQVTNFYAEWQE